MPPLTLKFDARYHRYSVNGTDVPSVTTILKASWPAPALTYWAANQAATYATTRWAELTELDVIGRYEKIRKAPWSERDRSAVRGTTIHRFGEQLAHGEAVEVPPALEPVVQGYADWLDRFGVEVVAAERAVAYLPPDNLRLPYAGTFDLIADLNDGNRWLLDIKTGSGVYPEHVLQLAAYRHATHYQPEPKGELQPMLEIDRVGVIHVLPDEVRLIPVAADRRAWWVFTHACHVALYARDVDAAYKEGRPWPIEEAMTA
jgi:hypothetical protein